MLEPNDEILKEPEDEDYFYLFSCGRDGTFKKFLVKRTCNYTSSNAEGNDKITFNDLKKKDFCLSLKESKNFYSLNSLEDFFIIEETKLNQLAIPSENIYFAGHYARDLCFYDLKNNLNFYTNEVKGVHRPFDIVMKAEEGILV